MHRKGSSDGCDRSPGLCRWFSFYGSFRRPGRSPANASTGDPLGRSRDREDLLLEYFLRARESGPKFIRKEDLVTVRWEMKHYETMKTRFNRWADLVAE
jgi:hypothetical protein